MVAFNRFKLPLANVAYVLCLERNPGLSQACRPSYLALRNQDYYYYTSWVVNRQSPEDFLRVTKYVTVIYCVGVWLILGPPVGVLNEVVLLPK